MSTTRPYRTPGWLHRESETSSVDPDARELHNRLTTALERGDAAEALRLMQELRAASGDLHPNSGRRTDNRGGVAAIVSCVNVAEPDRIPVGIGAYDLESEEIAMAENQSGMNC